MGKIEATITRNNFDIDFTGFKGTTKTEYETLDKCFLSIKDDIIKFELIQISKKIQPLDILVRFKNTVTTGQLILSVKDEDNNDVGKIKFKNLKIVEIKDLIDFDLSEERKDSFIHVKIEHDGISYETKSGKEEKI